MHPCHLAAREYHALGLHPIPCAARSKRPLIEWRQFQSEPPTSAQIDSWWQQWPDANVALVLGRGTIAVDADGGSAALKALREQHGITLPDCPTSRTAKGLHCLLAAPGPVPDRVALVKGEDCQIDIRGVGIIVAPPSIHPTGAQYQWETPLTLPLPPAPPALLALIAADRQREPASSPSGQSWVSEALRGVPEGQRDDTCARLAGYLLQAGVPAPIAESLLIESFGRNCTPPLPAQDVRKTVLSVSRKDARNSQDSPIGVHHIRDVLRTWERQVDEGPPRSVRTPYPSLNRPLGGGFRAGELVYVGARPGVGKALCLETVLPTPNGWTTMGEVCKGDTLFDEQGKPCPVVFTSPVFFDHPCYKLTFSDGSVIVSDAEHQWFTWTNSARKSAALLLPKRRSSPFSRDFRWQNILPSVVTTEQIARSLHVNFRNGRRANHAIPVAGTLVSPLCDLPIPPYTLGAWLGDGKSCDALLFTADQEVLEQIRLDGIAVSPPLQGNGGRALTYRLGGTGGRCGDPRLKSRTLRAVLRRNNLLNSKHIPGDYFRASEAQRVRLLSGLMDTDGYANQCGLCDFCSTNKRLADGVFELVASLGMVPRMATKIPTLNGKKCSRAWMVRFSPNRRIFHVKQKAMRAQFDTRRKTTHFRYIVQVDPVPSVPVRCIQVDSPSSLYLAGSSMIPTHNSALSLEIARSAAADGVPVLVVSREMVAARLVERIISQASRIPASTVRTGSLSAEQWAMYAQAREILSGLPIWMTDEALSMAHVCGLLERCPGIGLLIVDYLQLVQAPREVRERRLQVESVSQALKTVAVQYKIPVVCMSSLSRAESGNRDRMPQLSDLRESGELEHDADVILLLHRGFEEEETSVVVAKNRNGRVGKITLRFRPEFVAFEMGEIGDG